MTTVATVLAVIIALANTPFVWLFFGGLAWAIWTTTKQEVGK